MSTTLLRGPKDPELFRVKVNRTRWYRDPLPADGKWSPMTEAVPAVSTVKGAWSKPFKKKTPTGLVVPLDAYRAADYVQQNLRELAAMHPEQAFIEVATAPDRDLAKAANRGTALHSVMEALAVGQRIAPELHDDAVRPFLSACEAFVDEWQPVWRMTEFVVINRTLGFAGTADALIEFPGALCPTCGEPFGLTVVDWKSRGSVHGAYEEEVCQLGAYSSGEYVVITNEAGHLERIDPPEIAHGAVVSITADDGYRVYPVEIADARHAFLGMFETWRIGRDGKSVARRAVGLPAPRPARAKDRQHDDGNDDRLPHGEAERASEHALHNADAGNDRNLFAETGASVADALPLQRVAGASPPPNAPHAEVDAAVSEPRDEQQTWHGVMQAVGDTNTDRHSRSGDGEQLPPTEQEPSEQTSRSFDIGHLRSRVVAIVQAAAGRPLPVPWPDDTPTFKAGGVSAEHLPAIAEWCWSTERELGLPFPPPNPQELTPQPPEPPATPSATASRRAEAEEWAAKGRSLLSLLHDETLARACAQTAGCDDAVMTREHYLVLQAVVTQMSEPTGVLVGYWSGDGVELRAVNDMEKALLSQMPTEGTITKATKLEALNRGKRVAKRLGVPSPKTYDELCADLLLAACVAVGHGINREQS